MPDVRESSQLLLRRAVVALARVNSRHPWSHNDHFHGWILRNLPESRGHALDVGCGRGELVLRLAPHFARVDGVDIDPGMAAAAAAATAHDPTITIRHTDVATLDVRYDLITMVAVLHHLDLDEALQHAATLLTDGGRLLVVGLARQTTSVDLVWDLVSALLNPLVGLAKHPHRAPEAPHPFPVRPPTHDLREIRAVAARVLPGARVRRRLFFRYTLEWTRASSTSSG